MQGNIEDDTRISKCNFGSRQGYLVENALLEKRLLYESNLFTEQKIVHTISDLEVCYDRQMPNYACMVGESIGVERSPCILFSKLIPRFTHYLCASFGISSITYGGDHDLLGGTGQGNVLSGNACRDQSCIIFKNMEQQELGVIIITQSANSELNVYQ